MLEKRTLVLGTYYLVLAHPGSHTGYGEVKLSLASRPQLLQNLFSSPEEAARPTMKSAALRGSHADQSRGSVPWKVPKNFHPIGLFVFSSFNQAV